MLIMVQKYKGWHCVRVIKGSNKMIILINYLHLHFYNIINVQIKTTIY